MLERFIGFIGKTIGSIGQAIGEFVHSYDHDIAVARCAILSALAKDSFGVLSAAELEKKAGIDSLHHFDTAVHMLLTDGLIELVGNPGSTRGAMYHITIHGRESLRSEYLERVVTPLATPH